MIDKIVEILAEADMGLDDVVSTTVYLQTLDDYAVMNNEAEEPFKPLRVA